MSILIIPGLHGSEPRHWQSQWQSSLEDAERVEQVNWGAPDLETWLDVLVAHVRRRPGAILVGHSLGATLIAHLSAQYPGLDVAGALVVAPADPERRRSRVPGIASFRPLPQIPLNFPAILVASRTDPFMAQDRARIIANLWEAAFVDAGDAGHINAASGYGSWPAGLRLLDQLRRSRSAMLPNAPMRLVSPASAAISS
jgi:predicted alpha/beta hydrolase family esterase